MIVLDLTGQTFGRLTAIERGTTYVRPGGGVSARWRCLCECGQIAEVITAHLRSGLTQSCGCLQKDRTAETQRKDRVSYSGVHHRLKQLHGPASAHTCACGERAKDWCYDGLDPDELIGGKDMCRYSLDPAHYVAKCRSCHRQYDKRSA